MHPRALIARLEALRRNRARTDAPTGAASDFEKLTRDAARNADNLSGIAECWTTVCPSDLLAETRIVSFRDGVLKIAVSSHAARYRLDRWIRATGLQAARAIAPTALRRIDTTTAPPAPQT